MASSQSPLTQASLALAERQGADPWPFVNALYADLLFGGLRYFLPDFRIVPKGEARPAQDLLVCHAQEDPFRLQWLEREYELVGPRTLNESEIRLIRSIGRVLSTRYKALADPSLAARGLQLFQGQIEDHYVSAFLDPQTYQSTESITAQTHRVANAIDVLRITASTTYENRRIATGALLFGPYGDPCHDAPVTPHDALPYGRSLTGVKSFHRLCDGMQTLALVDRAGKLVELVDIEAWAQPYADMEPPAPTAAAYSAHSQATMCGGHVCLVLTEYGEIKIFADGVQTFNFLDGRWHLSNTTDKYRAWEKSVGHKALAERLFTVALNMAEDRRGGLFVVLDDFESAPLLVHRKDLIGDPVEIGQGQAPSRPHLHYVLRNRAALELAPRVLESVARIDGSVVMDASGRLLAFGAIIRPDAAPKASTPAAEGGRTTAALAASRYGNVLKISEDGIVSFYRRGVCEWSL